MVPIYYNFSSNVNIMLIVGNPNLCPLIPRMQLSIVVGQLYVKIMVLRCSLTKYQSL